MRVEKAEPGTDTICATSPLHAPESILTHTSFQAVRNTLAVAATAALGLIVAMAVPSAEAATNCNPSSSWGTARADLAAQVIGLINQHRASAGLSQLAVSAPLTASSVWKSLHMAGNGYFDHSDPAPPVARSAYQRAKDCDYSGGPWGENIAWGYSTAQSVVSGWLGSSGHKANIENPGFTSTGVGVAAGADGRLYWTQNFGNDVAGGTPPPPASTPPASTPPASTPPASTPPASAPPASKPPSSTPPADPSTPAAPRAAATPAASSSELRVGAKPARITRQTKRARVVAAVSFVQLETGRPVASGSVRCRAEVDGRRLRVLANAFRARSARCAWRIPAWARGKQLTGVVALQIGDRAATRLFMISLE